MKNGGFIMDSKFEIYQLLPEKSYPKTILINENEQIENIHQKIQNEDLQFPLIAKPDVGLRGFAVRKINSINELESYNNNANFDYLIQEMVSYKNEVGVFFVKYPSDTKGKITGIVAKEFLEVIGNGKDTISVLLLKNPRFAMQYEALKKEYGDRLNDVLPVDEKLRLVPFGNHARGAKFLDVSDKISVNLEQQFGEICKSISGFCFGRFDIMYHSWEELEKGKFSIIELNGAASEPTHIYDPKHSVFFAWKELARHIRMMYQISLANNKNGTEFLTFVNGLKLLKLHHFQIKKLRSF